MDPLALAIAIITIVVGGFGSWYTYLGYKRGHSLESSPPCPSAENADLRSTSERLTSMFWGYPEQGGNCTSWAVKESFVLRGRLEEAREEPGLGVAIVTTELAMIAFDGSAASRIDGVIAWGLGNALPDPPHLIKGKHFDSRTSEERIVPDFRHTLAFAIILARTGKLMNRVAAYLDYALARQNPDGGWPAGEGRTKSEVFTVLYATEFLSLCGGRSELSKEARSRALSSRDQAVNWLLSNTGDEVLWKSGVLSEYAWDDVITTAWVLHRLAPIEGITAKLWDDTLAHAAYRMISKASRASTWQGNSELQRFRVEARVAAAVSRMIETRRFNREIIESMQIYLSDWRRRTEALAPKISDVDWDVSTVAFTIEGMFSASELPECVSNMDLAC